MNTTISKKIMSINRKNIIALIVTFFPDKDFTGRLARILSQFEKVVIVDNASNGESLAMLRLLEASERLVIIWNNMNFGVAYALNQGCHYALDEGFLWAATFDQDSVIADDYSTSMIAAISQIKHDRLAVAGCNYLDPNRGVIAYSNSKGLHFEERFDVITSGRYFHCWHIKM